MRPSGHFRAHNYKNGKYVIMHLKWWHKFLRITKDHIYVHCLWRLCFYMKTTYFIMLYQINGFLSWQLPWLTEWPYAILDKPIAFLPPVTWSGNPPPWINSVGGSINIIETNTFCFFVYHGINNTIACFCVKCRVEKKQHVIKYITTLDIVHWNFLT